MKKTSFFGIAMDSALLCMLVGVVLILFPAMAVQIFGYIMGALLLAYCLFLVIKGSLKEIRMLVVVGVVLLAIGGVLFFFINSLFSFLLGVVGVFILIRGLWYLRLALAMERAGQRLWWLHIVFAVLLILVAVLSLVAPQTIKSIVVMILGVSLVLDGVEDVVMHALGRKRFRRESVDDGRIYIDQDESWKE